MEIKQNQEEFDSYLNTLKNKFSDSTLENDLFKWDNISAILMLTIKKNWTTDSSNSNYQINSEYVRNFFPILQISESFPHWRLSVPCHISKETFNSITNLSINEDWLNSSISYRHKIQNNYPYIQLTLENELRPLKNSLKENNQIFFLKDAKTFIYYVFASREKIFSEDSIIITNPSFANVDKTQFEISELISNSKDTSDILNQSNKLKTIIFETFKYILNKYGENSVLNEKIIKDAKIEDRDYLGLTLPKYFGFDILVGLFDGQQNSENLKSSGNFRFIDEKLSVNNFENSYFTSQWNENNTRGLSLINFNKFLLDVSKNKLKIIKQDNIFKLIEINIDSINKIYYGAPGTGKSYKVDNIINGLESKYFERLTFHPEFDNSSFVGGYKPISEEDSEGNDIIKYKFIPQAFTNIYKRAWEDSDNQYYLVIEEINRGNCAEIFGEIFQLLDRNSNYTVSPSKELKDYLISNEGFNDSSHEGIINGLKLPPNLSILATMNTSDQSLFPMDSAFKRRWEWEYVPICYTQIDDEGKPNSSFEFIIDIQNGKKYSWIKFIEQINLNHIKINPALGMDKCIGNYFIKPDDELTISLKPFINKVVFYLWNDVFKDEENKVFEDNTSYEDFFPIETKGKSKIEELFNRIELNPKEKAKEYILDNESQIHQIAAEDPEQYGNEE